MKILDDLIGGKKLTDQQQQQKKRNPENVEFKPDGCKQCNGTGEVKALSETMEKITYGIVGLTIYKLFNNFGILGLCSMITITASGLAFKELQSENQIEKVKDEPMIFVERVGKKCSLLVTGLATGLISGITYLASDKTKKCSQCEGSGN